MGKSLFVIFLVLATALPALAHPPVYTEKAEAVPDLYQRDRSARLPGRGKGYCAPVAVSNSFVYLAERGFPALLPAMGRKRMTQGQLASLLGMSKYMHTSIKDGTSPASVLKGVTLYLQDRGVNWTYLGYQGWRRTPEQFTAENDIPQLSWIKDGLLGDSAVWLNLGWYKRKENGEYIRTGGHWVTLVGYGLTREGKKNPLSLLIHDPATRTPAPAGDTAAPEARAFTENDAACIAGEVRGPCGTDYVLLNPLASGTLRPEKGGRVVEAKGLYQVEGVRSMEKDADIAILDGAVVLKLKKMETLLLTRDSEDANLVRR